MENLAGRTVLISGASGFLPAYLVETVLHRARVRSGAPASVIALVRNQERGRTRFGHLLKQPNFKLLVQDVCSPIEVNGPVDVIIHAASPASPRYYGQDPVGTFCANVIGALNLLRVASEKASQCFLLVSSSEVYGNVRTDAPISETTFGSLDPTVPRSCYAEGKRAAESLCMAWHRQFGIPLRIVRPFHTYGPGLRLDDGRVFSDFLADVVATRDIAVRGAGNVRRSFCYVADAVAGLMTVLLRGRDGEAYNIGNPREEYTALGLAELLAGLFPDKRLRVVAGLAPADGYLPTVVERYLPDITKAAQLGWQPEVTARDGFTRTVSSME